jgi:hypothetical protein
MSRAHFRSHLLPLLVFLTVPLILEAKTAKTVWQSGKIVAVDLYGRGETNVKATGKKKSIHKNKDFWWAYCIGAGNRSYSAALRKSPHKSGLRVNESVRFSASRDRLYVLSPQGQRYELRVLRQDDGACCRE